MLPPGMTCQAVQRERQPSFLPVIARHSFFSCPELTCETIFNETVDHGNVQELEARMLGRCGEPEVVVATQNMANRWRWEAIHDFRWFFCFKEHGPFCVLNIRVVLQRCHFVCEMEAMRWWKSSDTIPHSQRQKRVPS